MNLNATIIQLISLFAFIIIAFGGVLANGSAECLDGQAYMTGEFGLAIENDPKFLIAMKSSVENSKKKKSTIYIHVYAENGTAISALQDKVVEIHDFLKSNGLSQKQRQFVFHSGYRKKGLIRLFEIPPKCSTRLKNDSEFTIENVDFSDAPLAETVFVLLKDEMMSYVTSKKIGDCRVKLPWYVNLETFCSSEITAFVIVSKEGDVIYSEILKGNLLARPIAKEAVNRWKFRPYIMDGVSKFMRGYVSVPLSRF